MPRVYTYTDSKADAFDENSTVLDICEIVSHSGGMVEPTKIRVGTYDDAGNFEQLLVGIYRVSSSGSSGQTAPTAFKHDDSDPTPSLTIESFNTNAAATTGSGVNGDAVHSQAGFVWRAISDEPFRLFDGEAVVVKLVQAPSREISVFYSITVIEEGG